VLAVDIVGNFATWISKNSILAVVLIMAAAYSMWLLEIMKGQTRRLTESASNREQ
jgi:hypothetical protein